MNLRFLFLFLLSCLTASAQMNSLTLSVTNPPVTGDTLTIQGSLRTWTNAQSSTTYLTNGIKNNSATNVYSQWSLNPVAGVRIEWVTTNSIKFIAGTPGASLTVTVGGTWASLSSGTNATLPATNLAVPAINSLKNPADRTNVWSQAVQDLNDYGTKNAFSQSALAFVNFLSLNGTQTASNKTIAASFIRHTLLTNVQFRATNSYCSNCTADAMSLTNSANYGNAFRSPGSGSNSEQFGLNATSTGAESYASGNGATASGDYSLASGRAATSSGSGSTAVGYGAASTNLNSISIGTDSHSYAPGGIAIGTVDIYSTNTASIGIGGTPTKAYQVMMASSAHTVTIPGVLEAAASTNNTFTGTNRFSGSVGLTPTSLASLAFPGPTHAVSVGNVPIYEISGATNNFSIDGFAAPTGLNQMFWIINPSAFNMTLVHNAGDPTSANRMISLTSADQVTTGPGSALLWYSSTQTRWIILNFNP